MASASAASRSICLLDLGRLFAQAAAFFLAGLALGGVFGLADRLGDLVGLAVELFELALQGLPLVFQLDEAVDVDLGVAVAAVLFDEFGVFDE